MLTEIEEGNKLIAEFMDYDQQSVIKNSETWFRKIQYHSSWDWLMSVVEEIEKTTEFTFDIFENKCEVMVENVFQLDDITFVEDTKIKATYKAVVSFIRWYSATKKQTT